MKIVVIIPTYNEKQSIGALIGALEKEFQQIKNHLLFILIVDGNSPDGTADVIRQQMRNYSNLYLIAETKKRGLGIAYLNGMRYAAEQLSADAFVEFDGDFQHDPRDIRRMVAAFDEGYDYVVGSRYIPGGSVPKEWAWYRKFLSRLGSLFARCALWLPTHDNTSGLKLTRVKGFVDKLSLSEDTILSRRYAYKIQLLYEMIQAGARVKEIPIMFLNREKGDSKSSWEDIIESLKVVFILRFRTLIK